MNEEQHDTGLRVLMDERYVSWIAKADDLAAADAARADAAFAARHQAAGPQPEQPRGVLADETA